MANVIVRCEAVYIRPPSTIGARKGTALTPQT